MKEFNFNDYEKTMLNAMIIAQLSMDKDGGFLYFETRNLIRTSIYNRLSNDTKLTPKQVNEVTRTVMLEIVDNLVKVGRLYQAITKKAETITAII